MSDNPETPELEICSPPELEAKRTQRFKVRKYAHRVTTSQERRKTWVSGHPSIHQPEQINAATSEISISSESSSSYSGANDVDLQMDSTEYLHNCPVWTEQELRTSIDNLLGNQSDTVRRMRSMLEVSEESTWSTLPSVCYPAAVLYSALSNNVRMLKVLLQKGADPRSADADNRTALHYASSSRSATADCIQPLLQCGVEVNVWDHRRLATPLMCAAASGRIQAVNALLWAGADINAGLVDSKHPNGSTALLWAVRARSAPCLIQLIDAGATVNSPRAYCEAPIHVAAEQGDEHCLDILLRNNADVRVLLGSNRMSALHLAAADGSAGCIRLLLEARADCNCVNLKGQTPLHLAVLSQSVESVIVLLEAGARNDLADNDRRTPLHGAAIKSSRSNEIIRQLIAFGADVNARDHFDYSPLHLAAINENSNAASLLIHSGADLSAKTKGGVTALTFLVRKTPDVIATIPRRLDSAVVIGEHDPTDADCELQLDFRILVPDPERQRVGESGLLTTLIMAGQRRLLQHPVIRAFLHLKWYKVRSLFLVSLCFYASFVVFLSANILLIYLNDRTAVNSPNHTIRFCEKDPEQLIQWRNGTSSSTSTALCNTLLIDVVRGFSFFFGFALAIKEIFQFIQSPMEHMRNLENYVQFILVIGVVVINIPPKAENFHWEYYQQHAAALLIVVAWTELLMHVGRFPIFGLYVQMFQTVAANIAKFLLAYLSLIIGFSLGLAVLFPDKPALSQLPHSLLTTMVMMTGELEYVDYFYGDAHLTYSGTTELIFFAFLLSIVIVLMNLLVGLAVSDIQGLQKSAGLDRLVRQARLIARMESIAFSPWLNKLPCWINLSFVGFLQRTILLVPSTYHRVYTIRPNDPRDDRFPMDVKEGILKILINNKTTKKNSGKSPSVNPDERLEDLSRDVQNYFSELTSMNSAVQQHLSHLGSQIEVTQKKIDHIFWCLSNDRKLETPVL